MSLIDDAIANAEEMVELHKKAVGTAEEMVQALKTKKVWPAGEFPIRVVYTTQYDRRKLFASVRVKTAKLVGKNGEWVLTSHELEYLRPDLDIHSDFG